MDAEPEVNNDRGQVLLFASTNLDDSKDFQAEIQLPLGKEGKKQVIIEPTCVYLPKRLVHGPVNLKASGTPLPL
jgi:hypothetical protein